jgi:hypothetical protein
LNKDVENDILKEISSMITPIITNLTTAVAHYENFERAYEYAIEEEKREYQLPIG